MRFGWLDRSLKHLVNIVAMSFVLLGMLGTAKEALLDHAKSLPGVGIAEEEDFVIWGRKFVELLVSHRIRCLFSLTRCCFAGGFPKELGEGESGPDVGRRGQGGPQRGDRSVRDF